MGRTRSVKPLEGEERDALTQVHGMYVPNFVPPPPVFRKGIGQQLEPCFIDRRGPDSPGHSMPFLEYSELTTEAPKGSTKDIEGAR